LGEHGHIRGNAVNVGDIVESGGTLIRRNGYKIMGNMVIVGNVILMGRTLFRRNGCEIAGNILIEGTWSNKGGP
jgi:hypothetical protein